MLKKNYSGQCFFLWLFCTLAKPWCFPLWPCMVHCDFYFQGSVSINFFLHDNHSCVRMYCHAKLKQILGTTSRTVRCKQFFFGSVIMESWVCIDVRSQKARFGGAFQHLNCFPIFWECSRFLPGHQNTRFLLAQPSLHFVHGPTINLKHLSPPLCWELVTQRSRDRGGLILAAGEVGFQGQQW